MNLPKLLKQAEKLVSYGRINEAIDVYQEILSEDFQNTEVHNLIADLYIDKRDTQRASRHLFKVASDYSAQGDLNETTSVYRKIIKILPRNILAREKLLEIFTKTGAKNELFNVILELCGIYEGEGNTSKTIETLEKLVSLDPSNKSHSMKLALFLNEKGLKEKSMEIFYQLARDFFRDNHYDEALSALEKIRTIDPAEKNLHNRVAEVYEKQGKIQKAIESLLSTLAADPSQPNTMAYLARLCIKAGRVDEAERIYGKLVKIDKSYLVQTLPFVEVLLAEKKIDRALAHIENLYKEIQDKETRQKCVEVLEEILKLDPQKLDAYRLLEGFYGSTYQYDQLALTLLSHADAYISKCEYSKALDLVKQLIDLEPYNEEYRRKYRVTEKLLSGGNRLKQTDKAHSASPDEEEEESGYGQATVDSHFDPKVSLITDEDIENFIVDIELLEKFGQHVNAIGRLEHVLKAYPQEIKLRQKLKTLYFDRKMPKKSAQECLEIAKLLQQQDQKEEANKYLREALRLNPLLSNAKREHSAAGVVTQTGKIPAKAPVVSLKGDLSEIGLLDVIQILDNAQKTGQLFIESEGNSGIILFNSGRIVNATYQEKTRELAMYALVAVKGGSFDYKPSMTPFGVVINNSNTNLLLEGLRLLDEANRDQNEVENSAPYEPKTPPESVPDATMVAKSQIKFGPVLSSIPIPVRPFAEDENPLDEL